MWSNKQAFEFFAILRTIWWVSSLIEHIDDGGKSEICDLRKSFGGHYPISESHVKTVHQGRQILELRHCQC